MQKPPIIILLFCALFILSTYGQEDITSMMTSCSTVLGSNDANNKRVGLEGGAYYYIKGAGFSSRSSNIVTLGKDILCPVIEYLSGPTLIVCEIPPYHEEAYFRINVVVDENRNAGDNADCWVRYSYSNTPTLGYIVPSASAPGDEILFRGVQRVNSIEKVDYLKIGEERCNNTDLYDENDVQTFETYVEIFSRMYVPKMEPGYYNVTQRNLFGTGYARKQLTLPVYRFNGHSYEFAVIPRITSLSSSRGSSEGQIITVKGVGFSSDGNNEVKLGNTPCKILSQSNTEIQCELQPVTGSIVPQGYHAGWRFQAYKQVYIQGVKNRIAHGTPPDWTQVRLTSEIRPNTADTYSSRSSGYFKAPVTGNYKFVLCSDDIAELHISMTPLSKTNLTKIVDLQYTTPYKYFFHSATQTSEEISLTADQLYYMELYHYQSWADDNAIVGVHISGTPNSVNNRPEVQSVKIICAADPEIVEFRINNAMGGTFRIKFPFLSSDGKQVSWTTSTDALPYGASNTSVSYQIGYFTHYENKVVKKLFKGDGSVAASQAEATTIVYEVTFYNLRTGAAKPYIDTSLLTGFSVTSVVTILQTPSGALSGKFTLGYGSKQVTVNYNTQGLDQSLRDLGFHDPIRIGRYGQAEIGMEWRIQFSGDKGPIDLLTMNTNGLTGCKGPIRGQVTRMQEASDDLFYETIPFEHLFTADDTPQITVRSNGLLGTCSDTICDYNVVTTGLPQVESATYTGSTLSATVSGVTTGQYTPSQVQLFLGNTKCSLNSYVDTSLPVTISASCPIPQGGSWLPKVHFEGIGYAKVKPTVPQINVPVTLTTISPTFINPNGGTVLTITGTGFPESLKTTQEIQDFKVDHQTIECAVTSVSSSQIVCVTGPATGAGTLRVTLNGVSGTYASQVSLLTSPPTISSLTPNSVNPVLHTNIQITGSNLDSQASQTKVFLKNKASSDIQECLVISSTTNLVTCKLLGAPTAQYSVYLRTSKGYTNTLDFTVKIVITSISPTLGSAGGGTRVTIQGGTFSTDSQQTMVLLGVRSILCDVISSTANQVECIARARDPGYEETPQDVVVATRIVEESICEDNVNFCKFTFSNALTPVITDVSAYNVSTGSSITLTGSGFDSTLKVTINDVECTIVSSTTTSIVFTIPATVLTTMTGQLNVFVDGKGNAIFESPANNSLIIMPTIVSIAPTTSSTVGALITVSGSGFDKKTGVLVGTTPCEIRSVTPSTIICKTTSIGGVNITYPGFDPIKCETPSACILTQSSAKTPSITQVSPASPASASSFTLTITGTRFDLATSAIVNLFSTTDKTIVFTATVTPTSATQMTATFTNVAAGTYSVEVVVGDNIATSTAKVEVPLTASVSSVIDSSIGGGALLTISGSGLFDNSLKDKNVVTVCGLPCQVIASTPTSLNCITPPFLNNAAKTTYPNMVEFSELTPTVWGDASNAAQVNDRDFVTSYISALTSCQIGFDFGAGRLADLTSIKFFPSPTLTSSTLANSSFQGSNDKTTWTDVYVLDPNVHDGWNTITFNVTTRYRYYRLMGNSSPAKCAIAEIQFWGVYLSDNTATDLNAISCTAQVTVNNKAQTTANAVTYKQLKTAVLSSINPTMGTSAGGTVLAITGSNFDTTLSNIRVTIDGVSCTVTSATTTQIVCTTGAAPAIPYRRSSLSSELKVNFQGRGDAVNSGIKYFYIDRWSEVNTWGGVTPPREGESVHIPAGQTILLDTSPPKLRAIVIEGALIFEDKDINLNVEYIIIKNGRLQIGTWDNPITHKVTITLHGEKQSPQLPIYGNKVIAMMEGILDIHGIKRSHTWTLLDSTANEGATSIVVQGVVDWVAGEEIVIASTEIDHYQSERRTITGVSKTATTTTLTFAEPLKFMHYGQTEIYGGEPFEFRAEVGLLSRNVIIQGDASSTKNQYGVHIMMHSATGDDSSIGRISYTEIRQAGQAYNLGRYPIHFHLIGNVRESFVIGNAVHHTYNRAITIHGVHFLRVQKNVAHWCMGHTIFIEDGIETHNIIEDNLVINTIESNALLKTDMTPGSFWITNPNNIWRRNHAAGSDRYGFWFDLREHPEGPSATDTICPIGERLGEFTDNQVHSSGRYGLRIFHGHIPRTYPCQPIQPYALNPPIQAEYKNYFGWKNRRTAVISQNTGALKFHNIKTADNMKAGIEVTAGAFSPNGTLIVENVWIVGMSGNAGDPLEYTNHIVKGLITPRTDMFFMKNVHFFNFGINMSAIHTCAKCEVPLSADSGARTVFVEGASFANVIQKVNHNLPYNAILFDNDASVTGSPGHGVTTHYYEHLDVPGCVRNEVNYNGIVCDSSIMIRRIEFLLPEPAESFVMQKILVKRIENNPTGAISRLMYRPKPRKSWAIAFIAGYSYQIFWEGLADFTSLTIEPSDLLLPDDPTVTLIFNHTDGRESYDVFKGRSTTPRPNVTTLWTSATANNQKCGDWYHDIENKLFYVAINGRDPQVLKVNPVRCKLSCPNSAGQVEKDGTIRYWSNPAHWPNNKKPQAGDAVEIPGTWTMMLDEDTPALSYLRVSGDLIFDDTKPSLVLIAGNIWVEGQLIVGTVSQRYTNNAKIVIFGSRDSLPLVFNEFQDAGNKVMGVTGNLTMYGALINTVHTRLLAPAAVGATIITVPSTVGWKVGDMIVIAPTQRKYYEFENRTITAISGGVITLDSPLEYYHYGAAAPTKETPVGTLDMRAEVGLLSRNVKIEGVGDNHWGAKIWVGEVYNQKTDSFEKGKIELDGVEMIALGQALNSIGGISFLGLTSNTNGGSFVRRSTMREAPGRLIKISDCNDVEVDNNVFYRAHKAMVFLEDKLTNVKLTNNLMIGVLPKSKEIIDQTGGGTEVFGALLAYSLTFNNSEVSGNIAAGCVENCYFIMGEDCTRKGPATIRNNVAHSSDAGFIYTPNHNNFCIEITQSTVYKVREGITSFFAVSGVKGSKLILTDTEIGIAMNMGGIILRENFALLENSYIGGLALAFDPSLYPNKAECSNLMSLIISTGEESSKQVPPCNGNLPWYRAGGTEAVFKGTFTVNNVTFENFQEGQVPGCVNIFAMASNDGAADNSFLTKLSNLNLINVGPENKIFFFEGNNNWIGLDNCGAYLCTGIRNILVWDIDGSFTGTSSSFLMPGNPGILDKGTCTYNARQNSNTCTSLWGVLSFRSLDIDFDTRIISPVYITARNGYYNRLNSYMDHVWDGVYPGMFRRSQFHSVVMSGVDYKLEFTGTVPNTMRWELQGTDPSAWITIDYGYTNPQSVKVSKIGGGYIEPTLIKSDADKVIPANAPCGYNIYNFDTRRITIKITGEADCRLYANLTNSIQATLRYKLTVEEFFASKGPAKFIDRVAAILKIPPTSIRIVEIRSGSTIVICQIDSTIQDDTKEGLQNAHVELKNFKETLEASVNNGDLKVLDSEILNSEFSITLMPETPKPVTEVISAENSNTIVIVVVTVVVAVIAMVLGAYFAYKRYNKKNRAVVQMKPAIAKVKSNKIAPAPDSNIRILDSQQIERNPSFNESPLSFAPSRSSSSIPGNYVISPTLRDMHEEVTNV